MDKDRDSNRRKFLRLSALAGIAGFLAGRVTETLSIPSVRADDGQPLMIGAWNTGSGSRTRLASDVPEEFPAPPGYGVGGVLWLENLSTTGTVAGVVCLTSSPLGEAVHGHALATSGRARGVAGFTESPEGEAIHAHALATTGNAVGVLGVSDSPLGTGVRGECANGLGVVGESGSGNGVDGKSEQGMGVKGYSVDNSGVYGESETQHGVRGRSLGDAAGVVGETLGASAPGVEGRSHNTGVLGVADSPGGAGVRGEVNLTDSASGWASGVSGRTNSTEGAGVEGYASASTGKARGVFGHTSSPDGAGVEGRSFGTGVVGGALAAGAVPIIAQGAPSQTANLQEWRDDSGKPLAFIDNNGNLGIGNLRITRDGNNFAFLNSKGDAIAVLDSKGNLRLKGKLRENVL